MSHDIVFPARPFRSLFSFGWISNLFFRLSGRTTAGIPRRLVKKQNGRKERRKSRPYSRLPIRDGGGERKLVYFLLRLTRLLTLLTVSLVSASPCCGWCCASRADHPQWRQTIRSGISRLPSPFGSSSSSHPRQPPPPPYIGNGHPFVNNNHHKEGEKKKMEGRKIYVYI